MCAAETGPESPRPGLPSGVVTFSLRTDDCALLNPELRVRRGREGEQASGQVRSMWGTVNGRLTNDVQEGTRQTQEMQRLWSNEIGDLQFLDPQRSHHARFGMDQPRHRGRAPPPTFHSAA